MNSAHILRDVDILADLTLDHIKRIIKISEVKTYNADEVLFQENTTSNELYIILHGLVEILIDPAMLGTIKSEADGEVVIATLRAGESFGEVALVDQGLRSASARCAQDDTRVMVVPQKAFNDLCQSDFEMGYIVMRNIAGDLSFKLRQTDIGIREKIVFARKQSA